MRGLLAVLLFVCCTTAHARCPQNAAFESWLRNLDSPDPLVQLPTAFSLPPLADSELIDAECIETLLPERLPPTRKYLIAQLAETRVDEEAFLRRAVRELANADDQVATLSAVALGRRGTAAVPILLSQLVQPPAHGKGGCRSGDFRPWRLVGLALERIGPAALPQIVEFLKVSRDYPLEPTTAPARASTSETGCRSSLVYLLTVVRRIDSHVLPSLYDALPAPTHRKDLDLLLHWMGYGEPAARRDFLNRHPELLARVAEMDAWTRDPTEGLSDSAVPSLLALLSQGDSQQRDWAFASLWHIDPSAHSEAVRNIMLARLADSDPKQQALPVGLLDEHGAQVVAAGSGTERLRMLMTQPPLIRQVTIWKGLRKLKAADTTELQPIVETLVDDIDAWADDSPAVFQILHELDDLADWPTLAGRISDFQRRKLTLVLQASACNFDDGVAFAEQLITGRSADLGELLTLMLAHQLRYCITGSSGYGSSWIDFWDALHGALGSRKFVSLGLRIGNQESTASRALLFDKLREALVDMTDEPPDPSLSAQLAATPEFLDFLKSSLLIDDIHDGASATSASLLKVYDLVDSEHVRAVADDLQREKDPDVAAVRAQALWALGDSGLDALSSLRPQLAIPTRERMIYWMLGKPSDRELKMLMAEAADNQIDDDSYRYVLAKLLHSKNHEALAVALARRPSILPIFLEYVLRYDLRDDWIPTLLSAVDSAHLRRAAEKFVATHTIQASDWHPAYWRFAASLHGESRRRLAGYLKHRCFGLRQLALGALLVSAQTENEQRRWVASLLEGAPFRASSSNCPEGITAKLDLHQPTAEEVLPFVAPAELNAIIDNAEAAPDVIARELLKSMNEAPVHATSEEVCHLMRWAIEQLGGRSSNPADQSLIDDALRRLATPGDTCLADMESIVARHGYDPNLLLESGMSEALAELTDDLFSRSDRILNAYYAITTTEHLQVPELPPFNMLAPSDRMQLPAYFSQSWLTFGDAWESLHSALLAAGYFRYGLFKVDGGFAVVTALEKVNADGFVILGRRRWSLDWKPEPLTLRQYITALFLGESGHYRLIAFMLAPQLPGSNSDAASELSAAETAEQLFVKGLMDLPYQLASRSFAGCHIYALVYEYERVPGQIKLNVPGALSSLQHLQSSGLWHAINGR